jgi:DNA-binding MarR family transcriptional regulator
MATLSEDELATYFALRRAADRLERAVTKHLREHDLTETQFAVLASLQAAAAPVGMTQLARQLVVSKSGLTYQAGKLERRGLVTRTASADDDRAVLLGLTADGRSMLDQALPAHVALVRDLFLDRVGPTELAVVRDVLERVALD